jgi:hypothetical protein
MARKKHGESGGDSDLIERESPGRVSDGGLWRHCTAPATSIRPQSRKTPIMVAQLRLGASRRPVARYPGHL